MQSYFCIQNLQQKHIFVLDFVRVIETYFCYEFQKLKKMKKNSTTKSMKEARFCI